MNKKEGAKANGNADAARMHDEGRGESCSSRAEPEEMRGSWGV